MAENEQPAKGVGGISLLFMDSEHSRADARMVAKLIALGVVPDDVAKACLQKAFVVAGMARNAREYAAAMAIPIAVAKLEMERDRFDRETKAIGGERGTININLTQEVVKPSPPPNANGHYATNGKAPPSAS